MKSAEIVDSTHAVQTVDGFAFARANIEQGLTSLEFLISEALVSNPAGYSAGTNFPTMADLCLIPQIYSARRFNVDLSVYPHINQVASRCEQLPAFRAAHPEAQPDFPPPTTA